jgi:hypothetical protein
VRACMCVCACECACVCVRACVCVCETVSDPIRSFFVRFPHKFLLGFL